MSKRKMQTFYTSAVPRPCEKLGPKQAQKWLRNEHPDWIRLARILARVDVEAASMISQGTEWMVEACTAAIDSGKSVRLEDDYADPSIIELAEMFDVLVAALSVRCDETELAELQPAAHALARALRAAMERLADEQARRNRETSERAQSKRDPVRLDQLVAEREAIEAERDAVIDTVARPWEERIEAIAAEEQALWERLVAGDIEPPKGYRGAVLFKRAMATMQAESEGGVQS